MTAQLVSDIHHYDRRLTGALSILDGDKRILEKNRKKIRQFLEYIRAEGLSIPRQVRYVYVLWKISNLLGKEFYRTTKADMIALVSELERQNTAYDTKLSEKQCVKRFYKWLRNTEDEYPPEVRWLKAKRNNNHKILPEHLLTEDEVNCEEHTLRTKTCLRCQEPNSPTNSFCSRCGSPLDMKTAMQLHEEESKTDSVMDDLLEDPEVKGLLLSKLKAMVK